MNYHIKTKTLFACMLLVLLAGCQKQSIKKASQVNAKKDPIVETYESGKNKIVEITSHVQHDVVPSSTEPISYVQVKNIDHDLNVEKIAEYFECNTVMGNAFLVETLKHPVAPCDKSLIVKHRKDAIEKLVNNPELKKEVEAILKNAATQEQEIIQLMSDFFIGKTCPELKNLALLKEQKNGMYPFLEFCNTSTSMKTFASVMNIFGLIAMPTLSVVFAIQAYQNAQIGLESGALAFWSSYFGVLTGVYAYIVHDDFSKAAEKRSKMHALNQLVYAAQAIEKLSDQHGIINQFKMSLIQDKDGAQMIKGLQHRRYANKKNYCFHSSAVHSFLYKVYKNDKHLAQMFASIAEMDAYNAIATKMLASKNSDHSLCFAQFVQTEKPTIKAAAFWNVLVENPVVNDLVQDRHIILTGPNAGGKTTAIRAVLQNIVLAQTYGIAAAESFESTQFDAVLSYLNISDDLIKGDSLFASEIKRAQEISQIIKALSPEQKLFFALDELFTGTSVAQGEQCAYQFIKKIATHDQVLSIYATHFDLLKELGKNEKSLMNYKVNAPTKNSEGILVYPYVISKGASDVCVALDMAKQANLFA